MTPSESMAAIRRRINEAYEPAPEQAPAKFVLDDQSTLADYAKAVKAALETADKSTLSPGVVAHFKSLETTSESDWPALRTKLLTGSIGAKTASSSRPSHAAMAAENPQFAQ